MEYWRDGREDDEENVEHYWRRELHIRDEVMRGKVICEKWETIEE